MRGDAGAPGPPGQPLWAPQQLLRNPSSPIPLEKPQPAVPKVLPYPIKDKR